MNEKNKILLFARDPGGANVITALWKEMANAWNFIVYGKDVALDRMCQAGIPAKDIQDEIKDFEKDSELVISQLESFLLKIGADGIITGTSADDPTEKYLWVAAKRCKIPSFAILDQWVNYGIRFSKYDVSDLKTYEIEKKHEYLPDKILVMDSYAKNKMLQEGIPEENIVITGQPHLELLYQEVRKIPATDNKNDLLIVYASEPICKVYGENADYWGYTERTIFNYFSETIESLLEKRNRKATIVIRPHPKEDVSYWAELLRISGNINYKIDKETDSKKLIRSADLIVGMSSMFLLESVLCGKKVMSVQIGLLKDNPFVLDQMGVLESITTKEELQKALELFLDNKMEKAHWDIPHDVFHNISLVMREQISAKGGNYE